MTTPAGSRIAVAWKGLPAYGARLLRGALEAAREPVVVLGTRPKVPVEGIEEILGAPVVWIEDHRRVSWSELGLEIPRLFFETSWVTPSFNHLTRLTKRAGGHVVGMYDNRYKGNLRQHVGAGIHRAWKARWCDAAWAPGRSGRRFCRLLGVPDSNIYEGLYSGWTEVFQPGPALQSRPRRMLFVGQYVERKGIDVLVEAWRRFYAVHPDWELHTFGQGPLEPALQNTPGTTVHPFLQSAEIAAAMRAARFVVMPSRNDHWPLTIHEAASSGCGLILTINVGNRFDLATDANSIIVAPGDSDALAAGLAAAASKSEEWFAAAGAESVRLASAFGPDRFARTFAEICSRFLPANE